MFRSNFVSSTFVPVRPTSISTFPFFLFFVFLFFDFRIYFFSNVFLEILEKHEYGDERK